MSANPLLIVALIACIVVAVILLRGISLFGTGGDPKKANKLMQMRIVAQFFAVIIIVVVALLLNGAE